MRGCLTTLLVLILLTAVLLGGAAYLLAQSPARAASATPVPVSSAAAERFDQKVAALEGATAPTTVEITDQEATSKFAEALAADPDLPRLDDPQVAFRDGRIHFSGTTRDTPIPVNVVVVGRAEARDGRLVPVVERIDTGRLPLPGPLRDHITGAVGNLDRLNDDLPIYVTDLRVLDGRLALTGRPK